MQRNAQNLVFLKPGLIDFETNQRCMKAQVWGNSDLIVQICMAKPNLHEGVIKSSGCHGPLGPPILYAYESYIQCI